MTSREEVGCFRGVAPDNNRRPDLSIFNLPTHTRKVICDVSITCPVPVVGEGNLSRNSAARVGRAAEKAKRAKVSKYGELAARSQLEFLPLIFESTGRMENLTMELVATTVRQMSRGDDAVYNAMRRYWDARISFCLQKMIADAILKRSDAINGRLTKQSNYEFTDSFVLANDVIHGYV